MPILKILIISDRRSRAESNGIKKLTEAFAQGLYAVAKTKSNMDLVIEKISINPCKGCNSCWQSSKDRCENIGDTDHIYKQFKESDLIIWSLPLFYFSSPSIMKAFVGIKPDKSSKDEPQKHVVISIGSFIGNDSEAVDKQFKDMYKDRYVKILCPQGELFSLPQMKENTDKYLTLVRKAAVEYLTHGHFSPHIENQLSMPLFDKNAFLERKSKR